jgi:hypothetical protein
MLKLPPPAVEEATTAVGRKQNTFARCVRNAKPEQEGRAGGRQHLGE